MTDEVFTGPFARENEDEIEDEMTKWRHENESGERARQLVTAALGLGDGSTALATDTLCEAITALRARLAQAEARESTAIGLGYVSRVDFDDLTAKLDTALVALAEVREAAKEADDALAVYNNTRHLTAWTAERYQANERLILARKRVVGAVYAPPTDLTADRDARVRREAWTVAATLLAATFPAQAVTQADWMGGRHDQHAADVAWLRSLAASDGK